MVISILTPQYPHLPIATDTGSSDLWIISDACFSCNQVVPFYPQSTFLPVSGLSALLYYGDSLTGTHAFGLIGKDTVDIAGLALEDQYFAAINDTNTNVTDTGAAGIFGLGFAVNRYIPSLSTRERTFLNPIRSVLWRELFPTVSRREVQSDSYTVLRDARNIPSPELSRSDFPDLTSIALGYRGVNPHPDNGVFNTSVRVHFQSSSPPPSFTHTLSSSFAKTGPFIGRLVATSSIAAPQFTITLQRDTVDVGGNTGLLSIGELPTGIDERNLTWARVRTYSVHEGGLPPPANSPGEVNSRFFE